MHKLVLNSMPHQAGIFIGRIVFFVERIDEYSGVGFVFGVCDVNAMNFIGENDAYTLCSFPYLTESIIASCCINEHLSRRSRQVHDRIGDVFERLILHQFV